MFLRMVAFLALLGCLAGTGCESKSDLKSDDWRFFTELAAQNEEKAGELHKAKQLYEQNLRSYGDDAPERAYENVHRIERKLKEKYGK